MSFDDREQSRYEGQPVEAFVLNVQGIGGGSTDYVWTSADVPLSFDAGTAQPKVIKRSSFEFNDEDESGRLELVVDRTNPVAALWIAYPPLMPILVTVYRRHRGDSEERVWWKGSIVGCEFRGAEATLRCAGQKNTLQRLVPTNRYQATCNRVFCGPGCDLDINDFTETTTVDAIDGVTITAAIFATHPDGYYKAGFVQTLSGPGERRPIVDHVGDTITILVPFVALGIGDGIDVVAGCLHTEAACIDHDNLVNHFGFPDIPTRNPFKVSV